VIGLDPIGREQERCLKDTRVLGVFGAHDLDRDEGEIIDILERFLAYHRVFRKVVFVMDNHLNIYSGRLFK
jgi:hypothetical protein